MVVMLVLRFLRAARIAWANFLWRFRRDSAAYQPAPRRGRPLILGMACAMEDLPTLRRWAGCYEFT